MEKLLQPPIISFLHLSSLQDFIPQSALLLYRVVSLFMNTPHIPKDLEFHYFMVTAAQAAAHAPLHLSQQLPHVGEDKAQQSTSPC